MFTIKICNYINKNILVTDIIAMLSLKNIELYFNQITKIQKKIVIHKIANEEIKLYMLNKYAFCKSLSRGIFQYECTKKEKS